MITPPTLITRLREEFDNLCEACFNEHASLEEGSWIDSLCEPYQPPILGLDIADRPDRLQEKSATVP